MRQILVLAVAGCSAADAGLSGAFSETDALMEPSDPSFADTGGVAGGGPAEDESDRLQLPPAQTDRWVFLVDPLRDSLVRVGVEGADIASSPTGVGPTQVLTTSDLRTAVVLSPGDSTISLVDVDSLVASTVVVRDDLSRLQLSPDGAWAVAWFDAFAPDALDLSDGLQSFSEASFVEVTTGRHFPMVVGYRPRQVNFTPDGRIAAVLSDDTLAIVDLSAPDPTIRVIALDPDTVEPPVAEEMVLDPGGTWAWVRRLGTDDLLVVDLVSGAVSEVRVGNNPTDLDLTADGATAVVVCRDSAELWLLQALNPTAPARVLVLDADLQIGQVDLAATGDLGILYSTAYLTERFTVWQIASDTLTPRALVKPIQSLALTPDGKGMIVFHTEADGADSDPTFAGSSALTVVDLSTLMAAPMSLPAPPLGHSMGNRHSVVVFEHTPLMVDIDHATLLHSDVLLSSDPVFTGLLPDLTPEDADSPRTWVSQEHDLGRISFWDPDDETLETITGFQLNGGVDTSP